MIVVVKLVVRVPSYVVMAVMSMGWKAILNTTALLKPKYTAVNQEYWAEEVLNQYMMEFGENYGAGTVLQVRRLKTCRFF